jgi:probable HAF family extracellular repeat protein
VHLALGANRLGYTITDLGSLGFGVNNATAINATGQVTASAYLPNTIKVTCYYTGHYCLVHPYHAFLWDGSKMSDLGTLGFNNSVGTAINRTGQVAGWAGDVISDTNAFSWDGQKMIDLGALGPLSGKASTATGINDSGQVVGSWGSHRDQHHRPDRRQRAGTRTAANAELTNASGSTVLQDGPCASSRGLLCTL